MQTESKEYKVTVRSDDQRQMGLGTSADATEERVDQREKHGNTDALSGASMDQ